MAFAKSALGTDWAEEPQANRFPGPISQSPHRSSPFRFVTSVREDEHRTTFTDRAAEKPFGQR